MNNTEQCPTCGVITDAVIDLAVQKATLLAICQEIASDPRVDLVDSERRIRLYSAIQKAGGEL